MKKIIKVAICAIFIAGVTSCNEDQVLNLTPVNSISIDDAFTTPSLIEASMNGVYNAAQIGQFNGTNPNGGRGYIWGAAFVQQNDCRGEDAVNEQGFYQFTYTATYDPGTANNSFYWADGYRLINRCNLMIEGVNTAISSGIINAADGNDYIGQAKFLRAITHFELLNHFARPFNFTPAATHPGIPYREVGINTQSEIDSELTKGRNTVADCYSKIIADLNAAETSITNTVKSKATRGAAIAFKTRVYLAQRDWPSVLIEAAKITNTYSLTSVPNGPFASNISNSESIFSISHAATLNPGVNAALASQYKTRRLVSISPIIWRDLSWLSDDKRREEGVLVETVSGRKYTNKYKDGINYTDAAPVIRYAEVLLNAAEANARLSTPNLPTALTLLNTVRNRSLANAVAQTYTAAAFTTPAAMVAGIVKERRIEFLMEGRRWGDIHRLLYDDLLPSGGIPQKVNNGPAPASAYVLGTAYTGPYAVVAVPASDFKVLWPIPLIETNNNPTLLAQQNPGW